MEGTRWQTAGRIVAVLAILVGLSAAAMGGLFVTMGLSAKAEIADALMEENVITGGDAAIPGVLVQDARTARAEQDVIKEHTFGRYGPYTGMERGDPNRETYLKGLTLRNSLNLAVMGFGVGDLAIGTGAIAMVLGLTVSGLAVTLYVLMGHPYPQRTEEARARLVTRVAH